MVHDHLRFRVQHQCIEIRRFRIPQNRVRDLQQQFFPFFTPGTGYLISFPVIKRRSRHDCFLKIPEPNRHCRSRLPDVRPDHVIPDPLFRALQHIHIPENAAHAEFVLVFHVASVAPFQHQHRQQIFTFPKETGKVKFRGRMGYLTVAYIFAVNPYIKAGVYTFKVQESSGSRLILVPDKAVPVCATRIFMRHIGGIKREGIAYIGVLLAVKAVHLPYRRHRKGSPICFGYVVLKEEFLLQVINTSEITEVPDAV